ncbi:MAG: ABC transporter permease, partial [Terriglobales bacterium]
LELKREPEVVFWVFVFPLLLAAGLGIAFRNKPADITSVVVIDNAGAQKTLAMLQSPPGQNSSDKNSSAKDSSGKGESHSTIRAAILDREAALKAFHFGKYDLAIEANADGSYTYYYDPARPESVLSRAEIDAHLQAAAGRKDTLTTSAQSSSEPGSRYIDFLIPGLLGMNLMNSGMWGIGFAIVEMRQRKLLKRFVATPMRRSDFLLALTSSRLVLMVIEVGLLLGFGVLVFHMRVQGSILSVVLLGSVGAVAFGGVGLLTASRAQKIESVSGLINLVMMPMWIFSGVFFSYQKFPAVAQPFIKALPLTALNDALRATIIEGASLASQSGRLLVLAIWGGVSFILALRWFRWT